MQKGVILKKEITHNEKEEITVKHFYSIDRYEYYCCFER